MDHPFSFDLSLRKSVRVHQDDGDWWLNLGGTTRRLRLACPGLAFTTLLDNLGGRGMTPDALCAASVHAEPGIDPARLYYLIARMEREGFLCHSLAIAGSEVATLEPISAGYRFVHHAIAGRYRLSRFACWRRMANASVLECPLGHARVVIHQASAMALVAGLVDAKSAEELTLAVAAFDPSTAGALLDLLVNAGVAFPCDEAGEIDEDQDLALRHWEFHDLLFHSRSRMGRHDNAFGGTFRFLGEEAPLPAVKSPMSQRCVPLERPAMDRPADDVSFFQVLETRRSIREPGEQPITARQLGEFLYRTARVKTMLAPVEGLPYETSTRSCPSGGGMHEIEFYLTVSRCDGIEPGLYRYNPLTHQLEQLAPSGPPQSRLLADASAGSGLAGAPDVLITLASRFQRMAWKYQSMAYATTLKNVGVLYQQMYLVATALNLAPCALGGGDSDLFAKAAGLDYYAETSVGEFMLSSAGRSQQPI